MEDGLSPFLLLRFIIPSTIEIIVNQVLMLTLKIEIQVPFDFNTFRVQWDEKKGVNAHIAKYTRLFGKSAWGNGRASDFDYVLMRYTGFVDCC